MTATGTSTGDARPSRSMRSTARSGAYFDAFAPDGARWRRRNGTYHRLVERIARFLVPPGRDGARDRLRRAATCSRR